jgi:TonB-dependent receptor
MIKGIFTRRVLAGVSLGTLGWAAFGLPAYAQQATTAAPPASQAASDSQTVDTVVVTGVRASLRSAQALKRNSTQIVDSVQAQDIGKLPDANTVEALQRITGVQIQRRYGEGATDFDHRSQPAITVRGLTQVRNFLDGRDSFSASGGRALDLEGIPPELLAGIDVFKNPPADVIEGGVGGVVNLRTRLPFDAPGRVISGTVKGNYYDRADKFGGSASGLYSNRFDTGIGEIGVLFNVGYGKSYYRQDGFLAGPFGDAPAGSIANAPANAQIPFGFEIYDDGGKRTRLGIAGTVQWRPNDSLLITGQYLRTAYHFYRQGKYFYDSNNRNVTSPLPGAAFTFDDEGYATKGTLNNQVFESARFDQDLHTHNTNYTLNAKWDMTDKLTSTFDVQYLKSVYNADRNGFVISLYDQAGQTGATSPHASIVDFDLTGKKPKFEVRDKALLSDPNNYAFTYMADALQRNDSDQLALQYDLDYDNEGGFFNKVRGGVRYADSGIDLRGTWNAFCLTPSGPNFACNAPAGTPFVPVSAHPELAMKGPSSNFFDGNTLTGGIYYPAFSQGSSLWDSLTKSEALFGATPKNFFSPGDLNHQTEKVTSGYVMTSYAGELVGLKFDGTLGIRQVHTETGSAGVLTLADGTSGPIKVNRTYDSTLPSVNFRAHLTDALQARIAYSKAIARPNYDQMSTNVTLNPATQINPITGHPTGSSGNPYLNPIKSNQYDATLEWYFASAGSATIGYFHKDVNGFLASGTSLRSFGGVDYDISTQVNTGEGTIKGFEAGYQQFFDFLPGVLSGLGLQANYTYVKSSVSNPFATAGSTIPERVPLEKLSKNSYNIVGLYEKGPVTARLAYNWRGKYLDTTQGSGANGIPQFQKPYATLDASISYDINKQIAVSIDAVNLTNRMNETYIGTPSQPLQYQLNDRRFGVSVRATY